MRVYGEENDGRLPVVCLPGLSRNGSDFHALAEALSQHPRAAVLSVDLRGRGLSEYDRNPANYSLPVELGDVVTVLTELSAEPAIFVGTSRGGILTMLLAAFRPGAIAGAVFNDIGPVIENTGLMRIKGYVGKLSQPAKHRGRRRDLAPPGRRAIHPPHDGRLARSGAAELVAEGRKARSVLRPGLVDDA